MRLIWVECVKLPLVPVTVTVAGLVVAEAEAVRVNVLLAVAGVGLKLAVTPLGRPLAVRATLPLNPLLGVIVMVLVPFAPRVMVRLEGLAPSEKSGGNTPAMSP